MLRDKGLHRSGHNTLTGLNVQAATVTNENSLNPFVNHKLCALPGFDEGVTFVTGRSVSLTPDQVLSKLFGPKPCPKRFMF